MIKFIYHKSLHSVMSGLKKIYNDGIFGYSYLELILLTYFFMISYITTFIPEIAFETTFFAEFKKYAIFVIIVGSEIYITRLVIGNNTDFQYKITYHIIPMVNAIINTGIYFGEVILQANENNVSILKTALYLAAVSVIPAIILVLSVVHMLVKESESFVNEFNRITDDYLSGNIKIRLEDEALLRDSMFGKLAQQTNIILDKAEENLDLKKQNVTMKSIAETLATTSEEINAAIEEIYATTNQMSKAASDQAEIIYNVDEDIKNTSKIIDDILNNIKINNEHVSTITLQTSILSLNAAIEASRAGDYGKGFAVVAENIRQLSEQTSIASKTITEVTNEVANNLENAFQQIIEKMNNVVSVAEETAASAEEVSASTSDINNSISELSNIASELLNIE